MPAIFRRHRNGVFIGVAALVLGGAGSAIAGSVTGQQDLAGGASAGSLAASKAAAFGAARPSAPTSSRAIGSLIVRSIDGTLAGRTLSTFSVACNSGEVPTGGGVFAKGSFEVGDAVINSAPDLATTPAGWFAQVYNNGAAPEPVTVYVLCAT